MTEQLPTEFMGYPVGLFLIALIIALIFLQGAMQGTTKNKRTRKKDTSINAEE